MDILSFHGRLRRDRKPEKGPRMKTSHWTIAAWIRIAIFSLLTAIALPAPIGNAAAAPFAGALSISPIPGSDPLVSYFAKRVVVFGVDIVATGTVADAKLLHAANIMAKYLDGNEDGVADNAAVADAMVANQALLVMFRNSSQLDASDFWDSSQAQFAQDLQANETNPAGGFDASLEEVLHLIQTAGYSPVYAALQTSNGSALSNAMDLARGGHFNNVPNQYPASAWYHYDDSTCDYECQGSEYFYWGLTTWLGAQSGRCDDIIDEWEPCTPAALAAQDPALYAILTNPSYGLPTALPDGSYFAVAGAICGDGITEGSEQCDAGEAAGNKGRSCCTEDCQYKPDGAASCDNNLCTIDTCTAGVCSTGACRDAQACSVCGGTCSAAGGDCACVF